jgi:succinate-acetate transporter protein
MTEEKGEPFWALASPLGGTGFAMTVWVVGFVFSGIVMPSSGIAAAAVNLLIFAGLTQFVAGIIEFRRGSHALGYTHGSYGAFGISTGLLFYTTLGCNIFPFPDPATMAMYWIGWAIITVILAITTIPVSKMFSIALWWLVIVFILFAIGGYSTPILNIGGYLTSALGLYTFYVVAAFSINTSFGKNIIPIK